MYWKFGSVDLEHLVLGRYSPIDDLVGTSPYFRRNWCYFFDQEPLNDKSIGNCAVSNVRKTFRMLANSEQSALKKKILTEYQYYDWYYFFHGFAALDWYRDAQYFDQAVEWSKPFISLNRLHTNDRSYRLNLVARLAEHKLLDQGHVSLHLDYTGYGKWQQELCDPNTRLSTQAQQLIRKNLCHQMTLDAFKNDGSASADFGHEEFNLWKSGLWHIVTETVFYHNKLHLTEKIFKPIVAQRPFMLAAAPGNLAYLKSYGFQTFDQWIDESYDNIQDPDQRLQAIVDQTQRLCSMSTAQLHQMHAEMKPVLEYNFNHLWNNFKHKIVNELVDNFEKCIRQWNNGRIDSKELPMNNVNFDQIKNILCR